MGRHHSSMMLEDHSKGVQVRTPLVLRGMPSLKMRTPWTHLPPMAGRGNLYMYMCMYIPYCYWYLYILVNIRNSRKNVVYPNNNVYLAMLLTYVLYTVSYMHTHVLEI